MLQAPLLHFLLFFFPEIGDSSFQHGLFYSPSSGVDRMASICTYVVPSHIGGESLRKLGSNGPSNWNGNMAVFSFKHGARYEAPFQNKIPSERIHCCVKIPCTTAPALPAPFLTLSPFPGPASPLPDLAFVLLSFFISLLLVNRFSKSSGGSGPKECTDRYFLIGGPGANQYAPSFFQLNEAEAALWF